MSPVVQRLMVVVLLVVAAAAAVLAAVGPSGEQAGPAEGGSASAAPSGAGAAATVSDRDGAPASPSPAPAAAPSPSPTSERPSPSPSPEPLDPITLAFGGDVQFIAGMDDAVQADPGGYLDAIEPLLAGADLAMVNLETAITDGGTPAPKEFTFRAPPAALDALAAAGVDVVTLANNHGVDYGEAGLLDTLAAAEASPVELVGAGRTAAQAYAPWRTSVEGWELAVFGATQVLDAFALESWVATDDRPGLASAKPFGLDRFLAEVESAAEDPDVDAVVVYLHWGSEGERCPLERQTQLATLLERAGADVVVGSHAHRTQAGGYVGDMVVHNGLGNFIWNARGAESAQTGVFLVTMRPGTAPRFEWAPARISGQVPVPLTGDDATAELAAWEELRSCTRLTPEPGPPPPADAPTEAAFRDS